METALLKHGGINRLSRFENSTDNKWLINTTLILPFLDYSSGHKVHESGLIAFLVGPVTEGRRKGTAF